LIIADEVFTGFHRTGRKWGFSHYDFVPDIVVISKALTNGLAPLSCVWAREPLSAPENFPPGTHSVTFANQPLGLAIADAVLDRFDRWSDLQADLARLERDLAAALVTVAARAQLVQRTSVQGDTARMRLAAPIAAAVSEAANRLRRD